MTTVPRRLGKYELQEILGRGGMAEVWKALDTQLQRYVAIKLLHTNLQVAPDFVSRFVREAQTVAALRHPNIVQVYDFHISEASGQGASGPDATAYMVMEYIQGQTLAHYIHNTSHRQQIPSAVEIIRLFTPISLALDYAHEHHTIHRDIKPANILLDHTHRARNPMGEPILSDFGLAKLLGGAANTVTGTVFGTPLYISPEQVQSRPVSNQTDNYALGVMLYEIFTGQPPFQGESLTGIMMQHLTVVPTAPHLVNPQLPPALSAVILKSLAKNPSERWESAASMIAAVAGAFKLPMPEELKQAILSTDFTGVSREQDLSSEETIGSASPASATLTSPDVAVIASADASGFGEHDLPNTLLPQKVEAEGSAPGLSNSTKTMAAQTGGPPVFASESRIPDTLTSLIGREQEVAEITNLLSRPEVRLLTLLGPGGIGKTRLSIAVASRLRSSFQGGTCFVPLAAISDPELVLPTIVQELGIKERGTEPLLQQLQSFVGQQSFLLVLDNFEQVVDAASEIETFLAGCPQLKLLVTSRAVLHLSAEQVVPVAPLALPSLSQSLTTERIAQSGAVTLFVQRARSVLPSFQLTSANAAAIAEVCVRLDGLPLAIELAAARVKLLPPQALLSRLTQSLKVLTGGSRSLPARQQTLRSTIQWSYDLLGSEEQALFRLLAVCVGGWTLEAAEALCQQTGQVDLDVLNSLSALLDNSLIQSNEQEAEEPRFQMLQTIREFGLDRLAASGERETMQAAHARYFLELAEQARPELGGPNQALWLTRLEQEHDNLREALEWALAKVTGQDTTGRGEIALRLGTALQDFWLMRGYLREERTFLERILTQSEGADATLRARALRATANVAIIQGDLDRGEMLAQQSVLLARELEDTYGIADSLGILAYLAGKRGKIVECISLLEEKLRLMQQVGNSGEVAGALFQLADNVCTLGEYDRGQALFEEALILFRQAGNELRVGGTLLQSVFWLWFAQGDLAPMRQRLLEGEVLIRKVGDRDLSVACLWVSALVALSEGESVRAASLVQESLSIYQEVEDPWFSAWSLHLLGRIEAQRGNLPLAWTSYQQSLALNQQEGEKWMTPFNLEGLAGLLATQGEFSRAVHFWGAAEALREAVAFPLPPTDRAGYEQAVSATRAQLGEDAFAAAWHEGRTMPLEQIIDNALKMRNEAGKE